MNDWKPELDAIIGARHGGASEAITARLRALDSKHPNVPEISLQLAWNLEVSGHPQDALPAYEKAILLGLSPSEHANGLIGLANCLRRTGAMDRAITVLRDGAALFPDNREFDAFLALALHQTGSHAEAIRTLMSVLVETSEDYGIRAHQRSLRHEATLLT